MNENINNKSKSNSRNKFFKRYNTDLYLNNNNNSNNFHRNSLLNRTLSVNNNSKNDNHNKRSLIDNWSSIINKSDNNISNKDNDDESKWISDELKKDILKCAIAYTLGSLFTFVTPLNRLIRSFDYQQKTDLWKVATNSHNLASVTVWFNPAKSRGSMLQAAFFALAALTVVTFTSIGATLTLSIVDFDPNKEDWRSSLSEFVMAFGWIGVTSAFAAFARLKMANQVFNSSATMACIVFYSVVVHNGGLPRLTQFIVMTLIGVFISTAVCMVIWPKKSVDILRTDISKSLDSFGMLLETIFENFTLSTNINNSKDLDKAIEAHEKCFTLLEAELPNALRERFLRDKRVCSSQIRHTYKHTIESIERLAQHLTGLRSCLNMRDEIMSNATDDRFFRSFKSGIDMARKPMEDLNFTCIHVLKEAKMIFIRDGNPSLLNNTRRPILIAGERIQRAIRKFDISSGIGLESNSLPNSKHDHHRSIEEPSLITQFYLYNLRETSNEIYNLMLLIDEISEHDLNFVFNVTNRSSNILDEDYDEPNSINSGDNDYYFSRKPQKPSLLRRRNVRKTLSKLIPIDPSEYKIQNNDLNKRSKHWRSSKVFENVDEIQRFKFSKVLSGFIKWIRKKDVKFAIRTGGALAILSMPSFIPSYRPWAMQFKIEWALISCFASLSPTVGQTNFMCFQRILGTIIGAIVACFFFIFLGHSIIGAIGFPIVGFLFSIPCFYIVVCKGRYSSTGRFILQSYNLTALYAFNLREQDMHPFAIGLKRSCAVSLGITFSIIISRLWWPQQARKELRMGLGDLVLDLGYLYNRYTLAQSTMTYLPFVQSPQSSTYSLNDDEDIERGINEHSTLLSSPQTSLIGEREEESLSKEFMAMELHIQIQLIKLRSLLTQTENEPNLQEYHFPSDNYNKLLKSSQKLLEILHMMGMINQPSQIAKLKKLMNEFKFERREMVGNTLLFFSVIASSFYSLAPLPAYLPPASVARERLVSKIQQSLTVPSTSTSTSKDNINDMDLHSPSHLLIFAYALCMRSLVNELDCMGRTLQSTFGVIGNTNYGVDEFERMFDNHI